MNTHSHAIVWIDHHEARVLHFNDTDVVCTVVHPKGRRVHLHHKANTIGSGRAAVDHDYHRRVRVALGNDCLFLLVGPSSARTELSSWLVEIEPSIRARIAAIETADRQTDNELVAHARAFFNAYDRMRPAVASARRAR